MTYDRNNTKKFIEQFTREDGLLELGKYNHDALAEAVVQDRQEAYEAGRREGLEEVEKDIDTELNIFVGKPEGDWSEGYQHCLRDVSGLINKLKQ